MLSGITTSGTRIRRPALGPK
ncbi:unnamed protein product [Darwinula stevensoni]|uniref:Uncharacterized protein n=1 Tax=Darwinula stevensoni TaxID=69355 RepID=A0A7R9AJH7_9CRUS|nr:unnamed protein product [Darwinula stevensoni]CAG0908953.1 unnamed protein product [Darwinula stevensoni]